MTGKPDFHFPVFNAAATMLRAHGDTIINPAESFDGDTSRARPEYIRKDITDLLTCDAIYMLPGWTRSKGARLEHAIAVELGLEIRGAKDERDEFRDELEAIFELHNAKRSDYTGDGVDLLANYRFSSNMVGLPIEQGMFMRMSEKIYRIKSIMSKGGDVQVLDESLTDTLRDICVIALLMKLSLQDGQYGPPKA